MEMRYRPGDNQYAGMIHALAVRIVRGANVAARIVGLHVLQAELVLQVPSDECYYSTINSGYYLRYADRVPTATVRIGETSDTPADVPHRRRNRALRHH